MELALQDETPVSAFSGVWIVAEQSAGRVQRISHELLTWGRSLADRRGTSLTALLLGSHVADSDLRELVERGADRVLAVEAPALEHFLPEPYARCMLWLIRERRPGIVIAGATSTGRTLMPYVAVQAEAGLTADCTLLDVEPDTGSLLQTRPAIDGNILATIRTPSHRPQMATVRPRSARPSDRQPGRKGEVERLTPPAELLASRVRRVGFVPREDDRGLSEAEVVVSVGRGIKRAENLRVVLPLVEALDGALGASRDAVDRGWLSYPHQVGLSGKTVSPRLYVALGISGAIQHLAGMQTSEHVVAVNSDPDAPIFRLADVGIVGDLFDVVPALTERLRRARAGQ
jgi:electron transfer flavoprotein alpha subunit